MKITAILMSLMTGLCFITPAFAGPPKANVLTVEAFVAEVLVKNPTIKAAVNRIKSTEEALKSAKTDFLPKASIAYSYQGLKDDPVMIQAGVESIIGHDNQHHWDVSLSQPLFTGFALSSQVKLAKLDLKTGILSKAELAINLITEAKRACYNLLLFTKLLKVAEESVEALTGHRDQARQFYQQGLIPQNDLLESEVALSSSLQRRERAQADVYNARAYVNMLMDSELHQPVSIVDINEKMLRHTFDYRQLATEAKKNRPELRSLKINLDKAKVGKAIAQSAYYPNVSLLARYERNGDSLSASDNDYSNDANSSVLLQASWTIFEWGKTKADVNKITYEKRALAETIRNAENAVCIEVNTALLDLNVALKNIKTAKSSLNQATENWRITKAQYQEQISTSTDILDARAFLANADSNYYGALYGYMISLAKLDRAVGR